MKTDKYMSLWLAATLILLPSPAYAFIGTFLTYLFYAHGVSLVIVSILIFGLKYFSGRRIRFMVIYFVLAVGIFVALSAIFNYFLVIITDLHLPSLGVIIYVSSGGPIVIIFICYAFIRRKGKQKEKQRDSDRGYPTPDL